VQTKTILAPQRTAPEPTSALSFVGAPQIGGCDAKIAGLARGTVTFNCYKKVRLGADVNIVKHFWATGTARFKYVDYVDYSMIIAGVDEAGRGPVVGPMVMCGVKCDEKDEERLRKIGVKDSKLLSPLQRERMYDVLIEEFKYELVVVSPQEIDHALADPDLNLNWLEANTTARILNALDADKAYIDCPSNNIQAYTDYLQARVTVKTKLVCEHEADKNYPVASAASIIAKVTRDRLIKEIETTLKVPVGSGYPADPYTVAFLEKYYDKYPHVFRQSWASYKKIKEKKAQTGLSDFGKK